MEGNVLFALGLTLFAGLSTGIGSLIGFMSKEFNPRFLTIALGFSAGVMIYVSMIEIFVKARDSLSVSFGDKMGYVLTVVSFFVGIAVIALIDKLIPSYENPHEMNVEQKIKDSSDEQKKSSCAWGCFQRWLSVFTTFPKVSQHS